MQSLSAEPETQRRWQGGREKLGKTQGKPGENRRERQADPGEKATQIKALHNEAAAARSATKSA